MTRLSFFVKNSLCAESFGAPPGGSEGLALLSTGQMTVKQVAITLGFDGPAYFSCFLKKQTGKSPTEWLRL